MTGGFETKNFHLIKELSKYFEVSAHFIQHTIPDARQINALEEFCRVQIHIPTIIDIGYGVFKNFVTGDPLESALYFSSQAHSKINEDLKTTDVAICSVIRTSDYIEGFEGATIFDLADSRGQFYMNNIKLSKGWRRLLYQIEAPRLLRKEKLLVENSSGVLFFNKIEAELYSGSNNVHVVPHGVNEEAFKCEGVDPIYSDGLSFIGKLNVAHNVDMILWFVSHVLPILPKKIKLYLIGSAPKSSLVKLVEQNPRVVILGYLDNPYIVLRSSIASICPLQTGGGIQNKIIESMASGALVLANSRAMFPFENFQDSGVIVCDSPREWADMIIELMEMPSRHYFRRAMGRDYAKSRFSWQAYGELVRRVLNNSIDYR